MRITILTLLVMSSSAFALREGEQIKLDESCYANLTLLRKMFTEGVPLAECHPRVVLVGSRPEREVPGAAVSPREFRSHLIGKLASLVEDSSGTQQTSAVFNFFSITRVPEQDLRAWAIQLFHRQIYPKLSEASRAALNERLGTFWASHAGRRDQLEPLITPIMLVMPTEKAAARLLDLEKIADGLGAEPPLGRSDIELRGIEAISNEWERIKRADHAVQAALIHYIARDQNLVEDPEPTNAYELQELRKRQAVRREAVKALTNGALRRNAYYQLRRRTAGLTAENVSEVVKLLDAKNPQVVVSALEVIAWQYAQEWVVTDRANEELELAAKLAALLKSPHQLVRQKVASAYSLMHPPQSISQIALVEALSSRDETVRARAAEALELGSTHDNRRIVDPEVFSVVIKLALEGDTNGRSKAAALLRQNRPVNLETITELVENFGNFNPAIQPMIRDVLLAAANRRTGLPMFEENVLLESQLRERLATQLTSGALSTEPRLRGLLAKKHLDLSQVFDLLLSEKPEEVLEAANILNRTRPELIRPLIHQRVESPRRIEALANRIKEASSAALPELLFEMLAQPEIVPTIGRNANLFAAVVNPPATALGSPRAITAYTKILRGLSESPIRMHSSIRSNNDVFVALDSAFHREGQSVENLIAIARCLDLARVEKVALVRTLLRPMVNWTQRDDTVELRRKVVQMVRSRVPIPEASAWAGSLALAYNADSTPEMRRMIAEIFVASYTTMIPFRGEGMFFSPVLSDLRQNPFATPPELLDQAIRELGLVIDADTPLEALTPDSQLAICAAEINKAARRK